MGMEDMEVEDRANGRDGRHTTKCITKDMQCMVVFIQNKFSYRKICHRVHSDESIYEQDGLL